MANSKYIIISSYGIELPIVFSPILGHNQVAYQPKPVSAGFCKRNNDGTYSVWGKSTSLGIGSRPEDAEILKSRLEYDT